MHLYLIDGIGPFFRGLKKRKINWSKIPFYHLGSGGTEATAQFSQICNDVKIFTGRARSVGFNAITFDDVTHLTDHPLYEECVREKIRYFSEQFLPIFDVAVNAGMHVYVTMDVFSATSDLERRLAEIDLSVEEFLADILRRFFSTYQNISGVIIRIGESDGLDVEDDFKSHLYIRTAPQLNTLLQMLLPVCEEHDRFLVLRTWTVGAYRIGDFIWHRDTFARSIDNISSSRLILSMKHGESDFFRYLPLNRNFFRTDIPKILELQTKREYEGCGEFPSFIGYEYERYARQLREVPSVIGISVWCQTGGWLPFNRLCFLDADSVWTEINTEVTAHVFVGKMSVEQAVRKLSISRNGAMDLLELLRLSDEVIRELYYHEEFARQKLFFRRVRIPPLIGVYWNTIFVNHSLKRVLRYFVKDTESCIRTGHQALEKIKRMEVLASKLQLPADDIRFMYDTFSLLYLARIYYYLPFDSEIKDRLKAAKNEYKRKYPRGARYRFSVQLNFTPFRIKRTFLNWSLALLLRRQRGYRLIDQVFTIHLLSFIYRLVRNRRAKWVPEFARKSALGVDTVFK